jgi:hypothetical protein
MIYRTPSDASGVNADLGVRLIIAPVVRSSQLAMKVAGPGRAVDARVLS